jgi:hypothetical protein
MSLDISLHKFDDTIGDDGLSMNWLRNPFGLERWAQNNVSYIIRQMPIELSVTLWGVCNQWNYDKSSEIDRSLFKQVVIFYNTFIQNMTIGYFWFDIHSLMQFVVPHIEQFPKERGFNRIKDSVYNKELLGIPQSYFANPCFGLGGKKYGTLGYYQEWFGELVEFAELLQDTDYEFYCSN